MSTITIVDPAAEVDAKAGDALAPRRGGLQGARIVLGRANDEDLFSSSYTSYYVGHEVRYPRYICNDCHRPGRWTWWSSSTTP